jgi:mono/diheme cytochrome c family protein
MFKNRIVRGLLIFIGVVVILAGVGYALAYASTQNRLEKIYNIPIDKLALVIPTDAASIERGKHLVTGIAQCLDCHGQDLGGKEMLNSPGIVVLNSANITPGKGSVVADFSDADWVRVLRHGLRPNGKPVEFMPAQLFAKMSDSDLGSVIAYLKTIPPVDRPTLPNQYFPIGRILFATGQVGALAAEVIDHDAPPPAAIPVGQTVAYGEYLATIGGCSDCHHADYAGGDIAGAAPGTPKSKNITPTGIGTWTDDDFIKAMRTGTRPDGTIINTFMPWPYIGQLTDEELKALHMFLKTLPSK